MKGHNTETRHVIDDILNKDVKFLKKMRSSNEKTKKFVRMMIVDEAHRMKNNQVRVYLMTNLLRDLAELDIFRV